MELRGTSSWLIVSELLVSSGHDAARFSFALDTAKDRGPRDYMEDMLSAEMNCFVHKVRHAHRGVQDLRRQSGSVDARRGVPTVPCARDRPGAPGRQGGVPGMPRMPGTFEMSSPKNSMHWQGPRSL